eukprot:6205669-Pleurochrysis_carterae.AAC.2
MSLEHAQGEITATCDALRLLAAASASAKLRILSRGFLPRLLERVSDLRALVVLPVGCEAIENIARKPLAPRSAGQRVKASERAVVHRPELMLPLLCALGLLVNMLAECEEAKLACVTLQLPLLLLQLWQLGRAAPPVRRRALSILANYVAHCSPAKCSLAAYSDSQGRCLVALLLKYATSASVENVKPPRIGEFEWRLCWQTLQSLVRATAATPQEQRVSLKRSCFPRVGSRHGRAKSSPVHSAISVASSSPVRVVCCAGEHFGEPRSRAARRRGRPRDARASQPARSGRGEGQLAVLREPGCFDALVEALDCRLAAAKHAAALCLRNLAFAAEGKAALLAKPRALPALLAGLQTRDLRLAALCSGALWALMCRCERAKVAMRGDAVMQQFQAAERDLMAIVLTDDDAARTHVNDQDLTSFVQNMGAISQLLGLNSEQLHSILH